MSLDDKLNATEDESLLEACETEAEELSTTQVRPMLISEINMA